jgi:hypothetical protein
VTKYGLSKKEKPHLPHTGESDNNVSREMGSKRLRDVEDIGGQGRFEHDRDVGRVKQFYWL